MSIYDSIGGAPAVSAAVDLFYEKVLADDLLGPWFAGTDMARQKAHMRAFLAVAVGGPEIYRGRDMAAAHAACDHGRGVRPRGHPARRHAHRAQRARRPHRRDRGKLLPLRDQVVQAVAA